MTLLKANPWRAIDAARLQWDAATVAHLHRRAGFGASWSQIQRDVQRGYVATLDELLQGSDRCPDGRLKRKFDEIADSLAAAAEQRNLVEALERAWLYRLIHSPHPLAERMAVMWHNHYPIGAAKVFDVGAVMEYSQLIRQRWDQPISKIHHAILHSAAMLRWLDGLDNSKQHPNENLAREFFELFALGEGAYSENDIRETARALTGLVSIRDQSSSTNVTKLDPNRHDHGDKTIFGNTGAWKPADIVRLACQQDAASMHIARRLFRTFVSDQEWPSDELLEPLAKHMRRDGDVNVMAGVEMILRSELFYAKEYHGQRVKSPLEYVVGTIRGFAAFRPAPKLTRLTRAMRLMGQRLFHTPSVAGWPGGVMWMEGSWSVARANFAAEFAETYAPAPNVNTGELATAIWASDDAQSAATKRWANRFAEPPKPKEWISWLLSQPEAHLA